MATEAVSPPTTPAAKMSRYRSVRRAQEQQQHHHHHHHQQEDVPPVPPVPPVPGAPPPVPAIPEMLPQPDAPVSRSMSRYHRRQPTAHATTLNLPPPPPPPPQANSPPRNHPPRSNTLHSRQAPPPLNPPQSSARSRAVSSPQHPPPLTHHHRPRTARQRADPSPPVTARQQSLKADDSARQLLLKEKERQRQLKEKYEAEARAQQAAKQAEIDRLEKLRREEEEAALLNAQREAEEAEALRRQKEEQKAEQERGRRLRKAETAKVLQQREEEARRARLEERKQQVQLEQEQARKAPSSPPVSPPRHERSLFHRKKDHSLSPETQVEPVIPPPGESSPPARENAAIRPGGGGIVPGIDAPTSAVNAGDRRVTVVCGQKRILLPVTPTTTPLDLIKTAATVLTEPIDVRTAVIQELFIKVSIIRPLRNYEYVRDVMNSWDYDGQNDLTIVHSDEGGIDQDDLLAYKVPDHRPGGMSCFIQYSSRPGKWSKRFVTLRPDGQLLMAKNEKAKDKDQESILTMTDYDIYSITQQKLGKVKPPKKICYAVKSLQKSNIFADESQYVHFFCTNDRESAMIFYKALQSWRSWYLKHELGEGLKKKVIASRKVLNADAAPAAASHGHTRGESVGSHYQLGAFSSLLDLDDFNKKLDQIEVHKPGEFPEDRPLAGLDTRTMHARKKSMRVKQPPPPAFNRNAPPLDSASLNNTRQNSIRRSLDQGEEETFSAGGLLGRQYTLRQAAVQEREQKPDGPFTQGPSLISGMDGRMAALATDSGLNRRSSTRSTHHKRHASDIQRSVSKRVPGMPEPLIDLTPTYKPPPQHANKGKGYNPGVAAGPLVESATSIEEPIKVPSSTDWRARPSTARVNDPYGNGGRTKSLKGRGEPLAAYTQNNHAGAPEDDREAFTGGLLAQAGYSQGFAPVGRGVMDGSKAKGPMIDLRDNTFATGGLLSTLPDSNGPVIDRSGK